MKNRRRNDAAKVEEALVRFFRRPIEAEPGEGEAWKRRVMSRIGDETVSAGKVEENGSKLCGLVWRFALVTSFVAVLSVAYAMHWDSTVGSELAELHMAGSALLDIATSFAIL